jgi:molybdopterin-guanine dinucleotide biosynthesis protein A
MTHPKEHKKHTDIAKPSYGNFNRNEWAIVGAQCSDIKSLADEIIMALSPQYKCAYVDAKHTHESENVVLPQHLESGAVTSYTDYIQYHQFNFKKEIGDFQLRQLFNDADMVLVNGNHFKATSQVVVIDETKRESLKKRIEQLTNIKLILLAGNADDVFDFIKDLPSFNETPVLKLNETSQIIDFFKTKMQGAIPLLNGLVLAGGKSTRMGFDKATIQWHAKEQQYYIADLLKEVCETVFISCRPGQKKDIDSNYPALEDTFTDLGPYGAILSAFREKPDGAWLVVACDLPLLDTQTLQYLKEHRNVTAMATAFESPYNHFPEPLITIWEPKSYPVLLSFLSQGITCPGKALRNMHTAVLKIQHPETLTNVNTPGDFERVQQILQTNLPLPHDK